MAHFSKHITSINNIAFASSKCNADVVSVFDFNTQVLKQRLVI